MNSQPTNRKRSRHGFTLVELMVVVLIIAVLAAMIVPRIINRAEEAKVAAARGDLAQLSKVLATFRLDTGRYPTTEEGLEALRTQPSDADGWKGPYLEKPIPNDPWQNPYAYEFPGSLGEDSFYLASFGSDKAPGGTGSAEDLIESE